MHADGELRTFLRKRYLICMIAMRAKQITRIQNMVKCINAFRSIQSSFAGNTFFGILNHKVESHTHKHTFDVDCREGGGQWWHVYVCIRTHYIGIASL